MLGRGADDPKSDRDAQDRKPRAPADERRVAAWIGASIVVRGHLTSSEDTTVAGRIEGDISVAEHTLNVAPRAKIEGDVVARFVVVHGQVAGSITAEHSVQIGETGAVYGDIIAPRMTVAEGAVLQGRLRIAAPSAQG